MVPEYGEGKMWLTFCYLAAISTHLDTSGYILIHQYAQNNILIWAIDYNHQLCNKKR